VLAFYAPPLNELRRALLKRTAGRPDFQQALRVHYMRAGVSFFHFHFL
jgi:hypothetical protein